MSVFGLTQEYLKPDPMKEPRIFVGPRKKSAERVVNDIKSILESGRPVKMVIYGLFGVGKTHLITNVKEKILKFVEPYYVECPSLHRRSHFRELEEVMMKKIGKAAFMQNLRKCFEEYQGQTSEIVFFLDTDADFVEVLRKGIVEDEGLLWRYLLGQKITTAQAITLSAVKQQIDDLDAVKVISITAKLFEKYEGKKILFIIDEMEKTNPLMGESMSAYRDSIRALMDISNDASILMIGTARDLDQFRLLNDDPIKRRIGLHNFKIFKDYDEGELLELMTDMIKIRRKPEFPIKEKLKTVKTQEKINEDTYPFSEDSLKEIIAHIKFLADNNMIAGIRPSELLDLMDLCISKAKENDSQIIDKKIIKEVKDEYTSVSTPEEI